MIKTGLYGRDHIARSLKHQIHTIPVHHIQKHNLRVDFGEFGFEPAKQKTYDSEQVVPVNFVALVGFEELVELVDVVADLVFQVLEVVQQPFGAGQSVDVLQCHQRMHEVAVDLEFMFYMEAVDADFVGDIRHHILHGLCTQLLQQREDKRMEALSGKQTIHNDSLHKVHILVLPQLGILHNPFLIDTTAIRHKLTVKFEVFMHLNLYVLSLLIV